MVIGYQLLGSRVSSTGEQSSSAAVSVGDKTVFTSDDKDNQHQGGGVC